jgi:hypothetical protein
MAIARMIAQCARRSASSPPAKDHATSALGNIGRRWA